MLRPPPECLGSAQPPEDWCWPICGQHEINGPVRIRFVWMWQGADCTPHLVWLHQMQTSVPHQWGGQPCHFGIPYPIKVLTNMYSCSCIRKKKKKGRFSLELRTMQVRRSALPGYYSWWMPWWDYLTSYLTVFVGHNTFAQTSINVLLYNQNMYNTKRFICCTGVRKHYSNNVLRLLILRTWTCFYPDWLWFDTRWLYSILFTSSVLFLTSF